MWVVKLGGSLGCDPLLPQWLDLLAQLGGGRVTVVGGGGAFAEEARHLQGCWQFDDLAAHNMAVLAMAQTAYQFNAMNPGLRLAASLPEIRRVLDRGQTAVWQPFELQSQQTHKATTWGHTSDSIALELACRLNAERLVVVKSCAIDPGLSLAQLGTAGVLDSGFGALSAEAAFPIDLLHKSDLHRMRALLLDGARSSAVHGCSVPLHGR
ncbi:MAG: aspartate kinase [Rubrivivax sp.]